MLKGLLFFLEVSSVIDRIWKKDNLKLPEVLQTSSVRYGILHPFSRGLDNSTI